MNSRIALSSLRPFASTSRNALLTRSTVARRCYATGSEPSGNVSPASEPASPPPATAQASSSSSPSSSSPVDPKLSSIVDQIEQLTLLQAAELVTQLKTRLNIQDIAMPAAGGPAAAPAAAAPAEEEEKPKEKTVFSLKLNGLKDPSAKAKVIKEVKALNSSMNLVEAKKFVESAPQTLKDGLNKEDVEKLKAAIEAAGGVVTIE